MENIKLGRAISRYWITMLVIIVLVFGATMLVFLRQAKTFYGSMSITVQTTRIFPQTSQYILQPAADSGISTVVATTQSWLGDPTYVTEILNAAHIQIKDNSIKNLSTIFKVSSPVTDSANYQIQYTGDTHESTINALSSTKDILNKLRAEYNKNETNGLQINLFFSNPTVTDQSSTIPLTPIAGLAVGIVLALVIVAFLDRKD